MCKVLENFKNLKTQIKNVTSINSISSRDLIVDPRVMLGGGFLANLPCFGDPTQPSRIRWSLFCLGVLARLHLGLSENNYIRVST